MIHLDFRIEQRDLFRASMELSKYRLAIAMGITALLTLSLIWLFVALGEQDFLLELSPLFIGCPLIAVGGQVLRLHAGCRKYFRGLPESQRRVQYLFPANGNGYDLTWGGSFGHILWQDLFKIVEKRNYFLIYLNRCDARILPKRGFHQHADILVFRQILCSQIGDKAKLLPESN